MLIALTSIIFIATFVFTLRSRSRRLALERKRQMVQTWPRAVATFTRAVPKSGVLKNTYPEKTAPPATPYVYSVRGTRYEGRYLSPSRKVVNATTNERALHRLSNAEKWRIYYNPKDPAEAYLSPGPPQLTNIHLLLDFFFLLFVPAVMIYSWVGLITHTL